MEQREEHDWMVKSDPRVAIIMPVYNAERFLVQAVSSVIAQTYKNWRLFIVDDGSKDASWSILERFKDPRICRQRQINRGQSIATNVALRSVDNTFSYVMFLDADDIVGVDKIAVQVDRLQRYPGCIAVCSWGFFENTESDAVIKCEPIYFTGLAIDWLRCLWSNETMMPNSGYLIPLSVMDAAGRFYPEDLELNIDFEYFTRMTLAARKVVFCGDVVCFYRKKVATAKTTRPAFPRQLSALESRHRAILSLMARDDSPDSRVAANMAISLLTYTYPAIRKQAEMLLTELNLGRLKTLGGGRMKFLTKILGYDLALSLKSRMIKS